MPQLIFKNLDSISVREMSKKLSRPLSQVLGCPEDWLTFAHTETNTYQNGKDVTKKILLVYVLWFKRYEKVQNSVAEIITNELSKYIENSAEITVIFFDLDKNWYYENGSRYE